MDVSGVYLLLLLYEYLPLLLFLRWHHPAVLTKTGLEFHLLRVAGSYGWGTKGVTRSGWDA